MIYIFIFLSLLKPGEFVDRKKEVIKKFEIVERKFLRFYPYSDVFQNYKKLKEKKLFVKKRQPLDTIKINILAIRVGFKKEEPDDTLTTGNGWFDLKGDLDTVPFFSEPPHDKKYFETYLEALKAYLESVFYGRIKVFYKVKPDVNDSFYKLPYLMRYYGNPDYFEEGLVKLLVDALHIADSDESVDFMDVDNNGIKDYKEGKKNVYIIFHAGSTWQTDFGDTPYDIATVTIPQGALEYYTGEKYIILNQGRDTVVSGILLPENPSQDGLEVELQGLLFHEFPHDAFYATDLYGVYGRSSGVGAWCLMGTGGWNEVLSENQFGEYDTVLGVIPSFPCAWMRLWFDYIITYTPRKYFVPEEWVKDTIYPLWGFSVYKGMIDTIYPYKKDTLIEIYEALEKVEDTLNFEPDSLRFPKIIFVPIDRYEYFLIEYRNDLLLGSFELKGFFKNRTLISPYGSWDFLLPGSGVLVWHINDRTVIENYYQVNAYPPYKGVDLVEADGIQDLDKWTEYPETWYGSEFDPFFRGHNDKFSYITFPSSKSFSGGNTFIEINNIGERWKHKVSFNLKNVFIEKGYPLYLLPFDVRPIKSFISESEEGKIVIVMGGFLNYKGDTVKFTDGIRLYNSKIAVLKDGEIIKDTFIQGIIDRPFAVSNIDSDTFEEVIFLEEGVLNIMELGGNFIIQRYNTLPLFSSVPSIFKKESKSYILLGGFDAYLYLLTGEEPDSIVKKVFIGSKVYGGIAISDTPSVIGVIGEDGVFRVFDYNLNKIGEYFYPAPYFSRFSPVCADFDGDDEREFMGIRSNNVVFIVDPAEGFYKERKVKGRVLSSPVVFDGDGDGLFDIVFLTDKGIFAFNYNLAILNDFPLPYKDTSSTPFVSPLCYSDDFIFVTNGIVNSFKNKELYPVHTSLFGFRDYLISRTGKLYIITGTGSLKVFGFEGEPLWSDFGSDRNNDFLLTVKGEKKSVNLKHPELYIYPSVVKGERAFLRYFPVKTGVLEVKIYTFSGHLVMEDRINVNYKNMWQDFEMNFSRLTPGLYILKWKHGEARGTFKFSVVR